MSRGPGITQRRILAYLQVNADRPTSRGRYGYHNEPGWVPLIELAGHKASASAFESTRRAVHRLAAIGLIETRMLEARVPEWGREAFPAQTMLLHARVRPPHAT